MNKNVFVSLALVFFFGQNSFAGRCMLGSGEQLQPTGEIGQFAVRTADVYATAHIDANRNIAEMFMTHLSTGAESTFIPTTATAPGSLYLMVNGKTYRLICRGL